MLLLRKCPSVLVWTQESILYGNRNVAQIWASLKRAKEPSRILQTLRFIAVKGIFQSHLQQLCQGWEDGEHKKMLCQKISPIKGGQGDVSSSKFEG